MINVSIIIPVFNGEKYLKKCLDSVKSQIYNDFEVIIINDGSTDNTSKIIETYLTDKRFKVINQDNRGIGFSRNIGIKKAKGEYIVFLDSDDYIEFNFLEKMVYKIKTDNLDMVVCDYFEEREAENRIKKVRIPNFFYILYSVA